MHFENPCAQAQLVLVFRASLAAEAGKKAEAMNFLRAARPGEDLHQNPEHHPLRNTPAFKELMRPRGQ